MALGFSSRGWTAVDGSDGRSMCAISLKTAVRAGDRPQVLAAAEVPNLGVDADTPALRELMGQMERGLPVLMTLPRNQYQLRVMPEPAVQPREMGSSLRWALSTESDSAPDDLNLAWMRIPTEDVLPGRLRQLYAITTPAQTLNPLLGQWRQAGVRPKVVDIRETALRNIAGLLELPSEGLVLVSEDHDGVGMVFTHQGSLYLDRFIEQPLIDVLDADEATRQRLHERIAQQLQRSIDVVSRNYPFMPVSRVLVAPAPEPTGLLDYLTRQLPWRVQPLDLQQIFDLSRVPDLAQSPALQARCLVSLGAALRGGRGSA
jgi:MSHA biogenesis protein MshI